MKPLISLILIPAVLVASVVPAYVHAAPPTPEKATPTDAPDRRDADESNRGRSPSDDDRPNDRDESTTTAPPPVGLTPRTDSLDALERSLRAPAEGKASTRPEFSLSWRGWLLHQIVPRNQVVNWGCGEWTALRFVASRVLSHAPPLC